MSYEGFDPQLKLAMAPQFAKYMAGEKVYPIGIEISPSGVCQATCRGCFYAHGDLGGFRNVFLDWKRLDRLLDECSVLDIGAITWTGGGEPSLYPNIKEAVETSYKLIIDQGMFTNALSMPKYDPSLLSWIRVTMTDKPYKVDCIKPLRACKTLGFAFNYGGRHDDDYLKDTLALAEVVRADYVQVRPELKFHGETVDIEPPSFTHQLMQVATYKFSEARKKHGYKTCEGYHFVPFLWEDGNVDICAYMRNYVGYRLGNIYKQSLKEILDSAFAYVPVHSECQVCCKLHESNLLIHRAREIQDVNFP